MNIDGEILNKILANQIRKHIKRNINHFKVKIIKNARVVQHMKISPSLTLQ